MKLELVMHVNQISPDSYPDKPDGKLYCRKNNKVMINTMRECLKCPYFRGADRGDVVLCEWKDVAAPDCIFHVEYGKAYEEFKRVNKLIRLGILK